MCRLRRNATYQDLHGDFEIGRTTAWDYDQPMVKFLAHAFGYPDEGDQEEFLAMLLEGTVCLIDGTLVPTLSWRHRRDLLPGKHRRHGVDIRLFVDLPGRLICASLAFPGSWHDMHCFREAGWVDMIAHAGGGRGIGNLGGRRAESVSHRGSGSAGEGVKNPDISILEILGVTGDHCPAVDPRRSRDQCVDRGDRVDSTLPSPLPGDRGGNRDDPLAEFLDDIAQPVLDDGRLPMVTSLEQVRDSLLDFSYGQRGQVHVARRGQGDPFCDAGVAPAFPGLGQDIGVQ